MPIVHVGPVFRQKVLPAIATVVVVLSLAALGAAIWSITRPDAPPAAPPVERVTKPALGS